MSKDDDDDDDAIVMGRRWNVVVTSMGVRILLHVVMRERHLKSPRTDSFAFARFFHLFGINRQS